MQSGPRSIFESHHEAFRETMRRFISARVAPSYLEWEDQGEIPREIWREAGAVGMLGPDVPEDFGGPGGDFLLNTIVHEELARVGAGSFSACLISHNDIVTAYLTELGTEQQKARWLPQMVTGDVIGAIGMTEPGAGSDLKAIRTQAVQKDGHYILNGQKTFITNGQMAELMIVAAKTASAAGKDGVSLFLVDTSLPGYRRGRALDKVGQRAGDTAEVFFDDVRLPLDALLGDEHRGFQAMMAMMPRERLAIAVTAVAEAEAAVDWAIEHVKTREAFSQRLADLQSIRFKVAELATQVQVARVFTDWCLERSRENALELTHAMMAKYWVTDTAYTVIDDALQLFGGYGYMREYPISRVWVDSRVHRIYGGSNEIMKDIIGKRILGRP